MDFSNIDIPKILKSGMINKFMDFSPQDFEDFISQLFRDNDYNVEQTKYSGDYGVDLIIKKENEHIAVQVKRYAKTNKVGVRDVNQVLGGRGYYKCDDSMIITTSSFTNQVKKLSEKTGVDLWDWNRLSIFQGSSYIPRMKISSILLRWGPFLHPMKTVVFSELRMGGKHGKKYSISMKMWA